MKQRMIYAALAVLALSAPAAAPRLAARAACRRTKFSPSCARPASIRSASRCGAGRIMCCVRSTNSDREVSVVVSARSGDVLSVTPVRTASRMPPPRGGLSWGPYERMPPGYVPPAGYRAGSPVDDDDDEPNIVDNPNAPRPPGVVPGAPPMRSSNAAPLPPRSGAIARRDAPPLAEPNVITADPDRGGMLPPPPERFPQRARAGRATETCKTRRRDSAQAGAAAEA